MILSTIEKIIQMLIEAFERLEADVPLRAIEELSVMIHRSMTPQTRSYHTLEHVFHLAETPDPIRCLAALFHDLVYYQIDRGFPAPMQQMLAPYFLEGNGARLAQIASTDRAARLTCDVFGYVAGQTLSPFTGLNEFASALCMNLALQDILPETQRIGIAACIEATIPFRGPNARGQSCIDALEERLRRVNDEYHLNIAPPQIEQIMAAATAFLNHDVDSFAEPDPGIFLDGSWKLLLESNAPLQTIDVYSIREYRQALQKMAGFLCRLNPDLIFHQYHHEPTDEEFERLVGLARRNVAIGCKYLGIKLLAMAVLEALAELTGGDAPLSLFMGDLKREGESVKRLENFLPLDEPVRPAAFDSKAVLNLLEIGRASESSFDMRNSPTAFFLYTHIDDIRISGFVASAHEMFAGRLSPAAFLRGIGDSVVAPIARACAEMVFTRRAALLRYADGTP